MSIARFTLTGFALAALVALPTIARSDPPKGFKNLQVLPKDISKDQLKAVMKAQSKALGVDCDFCHEMPDADKDTKHKLAAREMMRMTNDMNEKFFKKSKVKVVCATCHRGKEEPDLVGK